MNAMWCEYLQHFRHGYVSDRTVASLIKDVMFYREALQCLLTGVRSARRVLKELSMKNAVPMLAYTVLLEIEETDLAFTVVLSKDLWTSVATLYANPGVSRRSRDLALRKALRQRAWKAVMLMVDSGAASVGNCRRAFLEMVRGEELSLAVELVEKDISVTDGDLNFALRACLRLGRLDCAAQFAKVLPSLDRHRKLLTQVLEQSIRAGRLSCFLKLANRSFRGTGVRVLKTMFRLALQSSQDDFVLEFCQLSEDYTLHLAAGVAVKGGHWKALERFVQADNTCFSSNMFVSLMKRVWLSPEALPATIVRLLEEWCAETGEVRKLVCHMSTDGPYRPTGPDTADWCLRHEFPHLAFFLCLAYSDSSVTLKQILREHGSGMNKLVLVAGVYAIPDDNTEGIVAILKHLSVDDVEMDELETLWYGTAADDLITKCRDEGMTHWVTELAFFVGRWDIITTEMATCSDRSVIDVMIPRAATDRQWDLVQSLMNRCSQTPEVLMGPLRETIRRGKSEIASLLLDKVDPCLARWPGFCKSLLQTAVESHADTEEMVRVCIRSGISTREFCDKSCSGSSFHTYKHVHYGPLRLALVKGELALVKLLHESGATSNEELYRLKTDACLKDCLERRGRRDIVQYLDKASSSPHSLQNLCRLRVSHLIGCRPGRAQRMESLSLSSVVKDLVSFNDIL